MNYKDKNWLNQQYNIEKKSTYQISVEIGASQKTISKWLKKHNIEVRSLSESTKLADHSKTSESLKKKWQEEEYRSKMLAKIHNRDNQVYRTEKFKSKVSVVVSDRYKDEQYNSKNSKHLNKVRHLGNIKRLKTLQSDNFKTKQSKISKNLWSDKEYSDKMSDIFKSESYINNHKEAMNTEEYKSIHSELSKRRWANQAYKDKMLVIMNSVEYREKQANNRIHMPVISSIQKILYSILDDLGAKYYKESEDHIDQECKIGPYIVDCVIEVPNKRSIIVECQGDYWHSLDKAIRNDKAKNSYLSKLEKYELKYLWEHEFMNQDRIYETIKYWLGITEIEKTTFNFNEVAIKKCSIEQARSELFNKYHYLGTTGRNGVCYGAFLNNILIAAVIYSPLVRQNIDTAPFAWDECLELSRFCIHPKYQLKNFGSWFISRTIKNLNCKMIISYCDETYNHNGALYKACNFKHDKIIKPDYIYVDKRKWIMHKKTLYNHAIKLHMTESEFAEKHEYKKVYGSEKHRYIYIK